MPQRFIMVAGTFLLSVLLYIDRVCISAAKEPVAADLGLSETQMGVVFGAFALGYALCQTPSGLLADRLGPRLVLSAVVCFWSLFTGLTAAARGFFSLVVVRFLFGTGEAGAFPGCARAIFSWIPMRERGLVQGINFSGSRLGAALALPGVAWMVSVLGWRASFVVLAAVGVVWAVVWYLWFRDDPRDHPRITARELEKILATRQEAAGDGAEAGPLRAAALFGSVNMWLAMAQYFCSNFTFFFCLTWLFPHLKEKYDLEAVETGLYVSAPFFAGALGNWVAGWWVDSIYRSGRWQLSRRLPAIVGFALAAAGLLASVYMESPLAAIACLSVAIFGADMTLSPSWSLCIDIGRRHAGAVSGTMNMAGNLGSFVTSLAFPALQEWTGSATPFFFVGVALNLLAIGFWLFARPERRLEEY
jgi:ACS family glucarate transporter-like MFS transporter